MFYIATFFNLFLIWASTFVVMSSNPIYSIIFLILVFCDAGCSLFLYNFDFFGLIFIIIYVGAIAVLFLFIIMMLNIKLKNNHSIKNFNSIFFIFFLSILFGIFFFKFCEYYSKNDLFIFKNNCIFLFLDQFYNIMVFGQYFYNFFNMFFILAGIILLIALIAAVTLTMDSNATINTSLKQIELKQLSKSANILSLK